MMKKGLYAILAALAVFAFVLVGCGDGGGGGPDKPVEPEVKWTAESVEKVTLKNAAQVVYRFDLPSDKKWGDYDTVTADYMVETDTELEGAGTGRAIRLYGNYAMDFFQLIETTKGTKVAVANFTNGNGEFILSGLGGSPNDGTTLAGELQKLKAESYSLTEGEAPEANQWFTLTYKTNGDQKNGAYVAANKPADTDTGPFIFGLGLPGAASYKATFNVKNVQLKGKSGTTDVLGVPLLITKDGNIYPAYCSYGNVDGSAGEDDLSRTPVGTAKYPPAWDAVDPPTYTITFNLNNSGATFTSEEGLTVTGNTATKTATKYRGLALPKATRTDGYSLAGWGRTANAAEADKLGDNPTFTENTTLYAIWKSGLPAATADLVITPKIDSFGGLGTINHDAGYGPHNYFTDQQYDAMLWFGLTDAVKTAAYSKIQIKFTAVKSDTTDKPRKLAFQLGRASESYSGGTAKYEDVTDDTETTKSYDLDSATIEKGIVIQHNKYGDGTCSFVFTITEIKLLK